MEIALIKYINSCQDLINLIGKNRLFPLFATDVTKPALEYQFRHLRGGIVKQSQLSINVIWTDYDLILQIKAVLDNLLDFPLPSNFITVENIQFNSRIGGGSTPLYRPDLKLYQINLNFLVNWRQFNE